MDFKVNREIFSSNEVVFDGRNEQSVELDYILPDYFTDIFRVLKCQLLPRVVSHNINGDKMVFELVVGIKILYVSENSNTLNTIEQKMNYTKSVDLGKSCEKPFININTKSDYVNCRVVNQRRLDIRGAVTTKIEITDEKKQEVVTDAFGNNVQLKKETVTYPANTITAEKITTVVEELDLGSSKPCIKNVIRSDAEIIPNEQKVILNKLIVKGDMIVNLLYSCDNNDNLESMQFNLPFSQIVDVNGINDSYNAQVNIDVLNCEIIPKSSNGDSNSAECEVDIMMECIANKYNDVELVVDAYSTTYPCELNECETKLCKSPEAFAERCNVKASLDYKEGDLTCIYDVWAKVNEINSRYDSENECFVLTGNCVFCAVAGNENGCPVYLEAEECFEYNKNIGYICSDSYTKQKGAVVSCSYNMTSTDSVELKAEIEINGYIFETVCRPIITDVKVDNTVMKEKSEDYALKLYYSENNEELWEIAKKFSTSVNAIIEENELSDDNAVTKGMILIPMVD